MAELTELLAAARSGDSGALDRVVTLAYGELRMLAHQRLRRSSPITLLDTTALVNECYLRLVAVGTLKVESRAHFIGYAAHVMRSIVIDLVRRRHAQRRDGNLVAVTLDGIADPASIGESEMLRVDEALLALARLDDRLVQVVEMKYFAGLTNEEIATALGVNERTVRRDWDKARLLLHREMQP